MFNIISKLRVAAAGLGLAATFGCSCAPDDAEPMMDESTSETAAELHTETCRAQPDPLDGGFLYYIGASPDECSGMQFKCLPGTSRFDDPCGCGCIYVGTAGETCSAHPGTYYVSESPDICSRMPFMCLPGASRFDDPCGCGCIYVGTAGETCSAQPGAYYVSESPDECSRLQFKCDTGTSRFDDACGCGCKTDGGGGEIL